MLKNRKILQLRDIIKVECSKNDCKYFNKTMNLGDYEKHLDECIQKITYCP